MSEEVKAPEVPQALLMLKKDELVAKTRKLKYPAAVASKKVKNEVLVDMILAGEYPNEKYQEFIGLQPKEGEGKTSFSSVESSDEGVKILGSFDVLHPAKARIVFGGPRIDGVAHPFGFSVETPLTEEEMKKYGVGKGVEYHSKHDGEQATTHTYKIVYK